MEMIADPQQQQQQRAEVEQPCFVRALAWHAAATWSWNTRIDHCSICKNQLAERCVECQSRALPPPPPPPQGRRCSYSRRPWEGQTHRSRSAAPSMSRESSRPPHDATTMPRMAASSPPALTQPTPLNNNNAPSPPTAGGNSSRLYSVTDDPSSRDEVVMSIDDDDGDDEVGERGVEEEEDEYEEEDDDVGRRCCVVWSKCGHVFHRHCITRWVSQADCCPECGQEWCVVRTTEND